jgi:hypothetical protein
MLTFQFNISFWFQLYMRFWTQQVFNFLLLFERFEACLSCYMFCY